MTVNPATKPKSGRTRAPMPADQPAQRGEAQAEPSILGTTYKITVLRDTHKTNRSVLRYVLQAAARELLPQSRVQWCLRRFRPNVERINVVHSPNRQAAYYLGLIRCTKIWECPVCAAKITERRRLELAALIAANKQFIPSPKGGRVKVGTYQLAMLTFTMQHELSEPCEVVLDRLAAAFQKFTRGGWYQGFKRRYFVAGYLRALELTHGLEHGWHPHYHVLLFLSSYTNPTIQMQLEHDARTKWQAVVAASGGHADFTAGCRLDVGHDDLYPLKIAGDRELSAWDLTAEVTKQPVKQGKDGHRSLTDLLIAYVHGEVEAGERFIEAAAALRGRQHITPSVGLWKLLGQALTDEAEAAEEIAEAADQVLASLNYAQWQIVLRHDLRGELLAVAENGDAAELWRWLESIGVYQDG